MVIDLINCMNCIDWDFNRCDLSSHLHNIRTCKLTKMDILVTFSLFARLSWSSANCDIATRITSGDRSSLRYGHWLAFSIPIPYHRPSQHVPANREVIVDRERLSSVQWLVI